MKFMFAVVAAFWLMCGNAFAGYTVTISQVGGNVVAAGSGSLNLTAISPRLGISSFNPEIDSGFGYLGIGAVNNADVYLGISGPLGFGVGGTFISDSSSGPITGILAGPGVLFVPTGYVSGTPLPSTATWNGRTIASMGLTPGTHIWRWGTAGVDADSFTIIINAAPSTPASIPTLSTWALAGLSVMLALLSISRTRRQSSSRRTGTSLFLCVLGILLYIPATPSAAGTSCLADTSQSNFLAGVLTNVDLNTSPGDAMLMSGPRIDQQNTAGTTTGTGFGTPTWTSQTFTAAVTGTLVQADGELFCNGCGATPPDLTLSVRTTSAGLPTGADLASTTISGSAFASGSVTSFAATFSTPAALVAGTQYALILRPVSAPAGAGYFWIRSSPSTYSGGSRVLSADSGGTWSIDTTRDFNFKTYIDSGYLPSGDLVSSLKDAGTATSWLTLSSTSLVPVNTTLQFHVAASNNPAGPFNFVGPDGTAATYFQSSSASLSQFNGFRYLKYKAYLATTDSAVTPLLNDATVCFVSQDGLAAVPTLTEWGLILLSAALALLGVMLRRYLG